MAVRLYTHGADLYVLPGAVCYHRGTHDPRQGGMEGDARERPTNRSNHGVIQYKFFLEKQSRQTNV